MFLGEVVRRSILESEGAVREGIIGIFGENVAGG